MAPKHSQKPLSTDRKSRRLGPEQSRTSSVERRSRLPLRLEDPQTVIAIKPLSIRPHVGNILPSIGRRGLASVSIHASTANASSFTQHRSRRYFRSRSGRRCPRHRSTFARARIRQILLVLRRASDGQQFPCLFTSVHPGVVAERRPFSNDETASSRSASHLHRPGCRNPAGTPLGSALRGRQPGSRNPDSARTSRRPIRQVRRRPTGALPRLRTGGGRLQSPSHRQRPFRRNLLILSIASTAEFLTSLRCSRDTSFSRSSMDWKSIRSFLILRASPIDPFGASP